MKARALLCFITLLAASAQASPTRQRYAEHGALVTATRLGAAPSGRELVEIEDRGLVFRAEIGREAIVQAPSTDALSRAGVHLERWLMPAAGLALVTGAPGEDGLDVAARLASAVTQGALQQATPNLYLARTQLDIHVPPNDPMYGAEWFLANLHIEDAWRIQDGDPSVAVAVVDDGCDLMHEDLMAALLPGHDSFSGDNDPSFLPSTSGNNHGTSCAGIVGARGDNGLGIAGACPECSLRCVRLLGPDGSSVPIGADVDAYTFILDNGVAVASNSWGFSPGTAVPGPLQTAMEMFMTSGRGGLGGVIVFAAGNESRVLSDAEVTGVPGVITVGALNVFDEAAPFSNRGPTLDITAPTGTVTTDITGADGEDPTAYTANFGGTSSSAPVVSGIVALMVAAAPSTSGDRLQQILLASARPAPFAMPDAMGHDDTYGQGIVDPAAALRMLLGLPPPPVDAGPVPIDGGADAGMTAMPGGCGCHLGGERASGAPFLLLALAFAARRRARA